MSKRDIRFRAWNGKEMFGVTSYYWEEWGSCTDCLQEAMPTGEVLMQFTGLSDKFGKDIFEDDIIEIYCENDEKYKAVIKYSGAEFIAEDINTGGTWHYHRWHKDAVIGNIHQNPELLKLK